MRRRQLASEFNGLPHGVRDLIRKELLALLMARPYEWRQRRSETFTPIDDRHYRSKVTLQYCIGSDHITTAIAQASPRFGPVLDWRVRWSLSQLERSSWSGETITLPVPIFTLPKKPLLTPDLVDGSGNSVTLQTRPSNSEHSLYLLVSYLFAAITEFDISAFKRNFSLSRIQPLLESLVFSMPESDTTMRLGNANLGADVGNDVTLMRHHLKGCGLQPTEQQTLAIKEILELGREVAAKDWESNRPDPAAASALYNPLLAAKDYAKLARDQHVTRDLEMFLEECSYYLNMLSVFGQRIDNELVREAFRRLATLTRSWTAISPLDVTLDRPSLVKLSSTIPLENQPRRRPPFQPLTFGFTAFVGDCTSTHIEVRTPDQAGIRLLPNRTRLLFGDRTRRRVEEIFGHAHSSGELVALYTTKRVDDVRTVAEDRAIGASADPVFRLNVRFRVKGWISVQYWVALAAGLLITGMATVAGSTSGKEGVIAAAVAVTAGVLATRERDIAGRALGYLRVVLLIVLLGLVALLGSGLLSSSRPSSQTTINFFPRGLTGEPGGSDPRAHQLGRQEHGWEAVGGDSHGRGAARPARKG